MLEQQDNSIEEIAGEKKRPTPAQNHLNWLLPLGVMSLAWMARLWWGYPHFPCDEHNWAFIAQQMDDGVEWPISGPLFFFLIREVAQIWSLTYAKSLAVVGTLSVPIALVGIMTAYRLLGVVQPGLSLMLLCTSTYFWAPLLESRPQQLGQILVMMGIAVGWRMLRSNRCTLWLWLGWSGILLLTTCVHILSAGVLMALVGGNALVLYVLRMTRPGVLVCMALAAIPAVAVLTFPNGPYTSMLQDIYRNHILWSNVSKIILPATAATAVMVLIVFWLSRQPLHQPLEIAFRLFSASPRYWLTGVAIVAVLIMVAQATLLPIESWQPYAGSIALFLFAQSGNLFFFLMLLLGFGCACQEYRHRRHVLQWQTLTVMLLCICTLSVLALLASLFLLNTNWMLRLISYGIFIVAPFAAAGLSRSRNWLLPLLCLVFTGVSLIATLR